MENRYSILQGIITNQGNGDMFEASSFSSLEEAKEEFEAIKNDTSGWVFGNKHCYLETQLVETSENDDDDIYNILELYQVYKDGKQRNQ